jgi:hypothetical protein
VAITVLEHTYVVGVLGAALAWVVGVIVGVSILAAVA